MPLYCARLVACRYTPSGQRTVLLAASSMRSVPPMSALVLRVDSMAPAGNTASAGSSSGFGPQLTGSPEVSVVEPTLSGSGWARMRVITARRVWPAMSSLTGRTSALDPPQ